MPHITNSVFTDKEKSHLEFVLSHNFSKKIDVIAQLNSIQESEITRDMTPYYWIMEFRPNGINPGYGPMQPYIRIQVIHKDGTAPTEFTLYERNGFVFELEIYNADSSPLDLETMMIGMSVDLRISAGDS